MKKYCVSVLSISMIAAMILLGNIGAVAENYRVGVFSTGNLQKILDAYSIKTGYYWGYNTKENGAEYSYVANTEVPITYTWSVNSDKHGYSPNSDYYGYKYWIGNQSFEECWGLAYFLGAKLSGVEPTEWNVFYSIDAVNATGGVRVGDIIRGRRHSAIVYKVNNDGSFSVVQCGGSYCNVIDVDSCFGHSTYAGGTGLDTLWKIDDLQGHPAFWTNYGGFVELRRAPNSNSQTAQNYTSQDTEFYQQEPVLQFEEWALVKGDGNRHSENAIPYSMNEYNQSLMTIHNSYTDKEFIVTGLYHNAYSDDDGANHLWWKTIDNTWVNSNDVYYVQGFPFYNDYGWNLPRGDIPKAGFPLRGTIMCHNRIQRVEGQIRKTGYKEQTANGWVDRTLDKSELIQCKVQEFSANEAKYEVDIAKTVIDQLAFGQLEESTYYSVDIFVYCYCNNTAYTVSAFSKSSRFYVKGDNSPASGMEVIVTPAITYETGNPVEATTYTVVTTDGLNLRSAPNTAEDNIITTLWPGTTIVVTEKTTSEGRTWGRGTTSNGYIGWCVVDNSWTVKGDVASVDTQVPNIELISISDLSDQGYTVNCRVSDNVGIARVAFPTWTVQNDQDDLPSDWGETMLGNYNNGIASYRVNTSEHNYERGCYYRTHIYAWDVFGNQAIFYLDDVYVPAQIIEATSITLNKTNLILGLNSTYTLKATILPENATYQDIDWYVSDPSVATVADGVITTKAVGTVSVVARLTGNLYTCCGLIVKDLDKAILSVAPGSNTRVTTFSLEYEKAIEWIQINVEDDRGNTAWSDTTSDKSFLREGNMLPPGSYTAYAILSNSDEETVTSNVVQFEVSGSPIEPTGISIFGSSETITLGDTTSIYATLSPVNANYWQDVVWESSNDAVVSIENVTGRVGSDHQHPEVMIHANSLGTAVVTISTADGRFNSKCTFRVIEPIVKVSGISLNYENLPLTAGKSFILLADIQPANANAGEIKWTSSDTGVASVTKGKSQDYAVVEAISPGTVTISASVYYYGRPLMGSNGNDLKAECEVVVNEAHPENTVFGVCGDNLTWSLDEDGDLVISGTGDMYNYTSSTAPWGTSVGKVVIKDGMTSIGDFAFYGCTGIENVNIPESVTEIGRESFENCSQLSMITIPRSVVEIRENTFYNCSNLTIACYEGSVAYTYARENSIHIKTLSDTQEGTCGTNLTWTLKPDGTLTVSGTGYMTDYLPSNAAPWGTEVKKVVVGAGVISIGRYAFYNCDKLESVSLPEGLIEIRYGSFYNCSYLAGIDIPSTVVLVESYAFMHCESIREVIIPQNVSGIGGNTFAYCSSLQEVWIEEGPTSIGDSAFLFCSELCDINIPTSITYIGENAFQNCNALDSITIPGNVEIICSNAFSRCHSLSEVVLQNGVQNIRYRAFGECTGLKSIVIPDSITEIESSVFADCTNLEYVNIPAGVTSIKVEAFNGCTKLCGLDIAEGNDFYKCIDGLLLTKDGTTIVFCPKGINGECRVPEGVTTIGDYSFQNCSLIERVILPEGVGTLGRYAFNGCEGLTKINLPSTLQLIAEHTFENCVSLRNLILPENMINVYYGAFSGCKSLRNMTFETRSVPIFDGMFDKSFSAVIYCYVNSTAQEYAIEKGYQYYLIDEENDLMESGDINVLVLPYQLREIEEEAFAGIPTIDQIVIPATVTIIASNAFNGTDAVLVVQKGSYAETWVKEHNKSYILGK